ncbi:hypothetical protein FOWG_18054 [Fusarium oxysporum f. sp. lycopersici MN25]|nr:hypothetical protein FOWG_18054 [Fusarium oxysporum f. sp. lycopersici MN25]
MRGMRPLPVPFPLLSVLTRSACFFPTWTHLDAVVGPLSKSLGGSSHASKFLTLTVLHSRNAPCARAIYCYMTGFITALTQVLGPILVTGLSQRSSHWYGLMGRILCLTGGGVGMSLHGTDYATHELGQDESGSVTDPLLSTRQHSHGGSSYPDDGGVSLVELVKICLGLKSPPRDKISALGPWIFFFIAIPQASRPLFATFAQQRCGLSPKEADNLWLLRSEISMFIFGVLLPCLMFMRGHTRRFSNNINLTIGRCSVILMASGATVIGVSGSSLAITIGSCFLDFLSNVIDNSEGLIIKP